MEKVNNTTNKGFKKAYNLLPAGEQTKVRKKIQETCGWTTSTFYLRLKGETSLRPLERIALESIFNAWDIDVWTGKSLLKSR